MAAEDFFSRWSKSKEPRQSSTMSSEESAITVTADEPVAQALPCMEDIAQLHDESDFSIYMNQDVDESVKRSAMKKLFSNPHFNVMDGLDIYIDDYSKPDPLPPGMLALLRHAETLLDPLRHLEHPIQLLLEPVLESDLPAASELPELTIKQESLAVAEPLPVSDVESEALQCKDATQNHKDQA